MQKIDEKQIFSINSKKITVYPSSNPGQPVIYLNTVMDEGDKIYQALNKSSCPDCTLVTISGLNWDCDMAPWDIPPISKNDTPCQGGADAYLRFLITEIIPQAEQFAPKPVNWRGLAGYSLAGLFAVYALYQTDYFARIASISGSLWFPNFKEYIFNHKMKKNPDYLYFSLGDKECRTKNPYLKIVQQNTEEIVDFYTRQNIETAWQLNPGNHFQNAVARTTAAINWLLSR